MTERIEIDGWICERLGYWYASATRGACSVSIDRSTGCLEIEYEYGGGWSSVPTGVMAQLQRWHDEPSP